MVSCVDHYQLIIMATYAEMPWDPIFQRNTQPMDNLESAAVHHDTIDKGNCRWYLRPVGSQACLFRKYSPDVLQFVGFGQCSSEMSHGRG